MKRVLFISTFIAHFFNSMAQTIVNPAFDRSDILDFYIKEVEITKDTTYVFCRYYAEAGSWASISKDTYLRDSKSHRTFPLQRCVGLPYSPETRNFSQIGSYELLFCFTSISGIEEFDFIESDGERAFNVYGVSLKKKLKTSYTDTELNRISEMVSAYDSSVDTEKAVLLKDYATSLNNLVSCNVSIGKYTEAIRLGIVELEIREKLFGKDHPSYIVSLGNLIGYYSALGKYSEAILLQIDAAEVIKNTLGTDNISYIKSLGSLMYLNANLGNYDEAIGHGTKAMEIFKKVLGSENPDYAILSSHLAGYYLFVGNYTEAIRLQTEATKVLKETLGPENINYAISLGNLALYNSKLGNYAKAIGIETEAMNIFKKVLGTTHPDYAMSLNNLATYNAYDGNYAEAVRLVTEAIDILKIVFGSEHPTYATSLGNLALYNSKLGNNSEAIKIGTETTEICKRILGPEHPDYATSLDNLATYYSGNGNYTAAIQLGTEAMEIRKRVLGAEHPDCVTSLSNLAIFNSYLGYYATAIMLKKEAMEICKRVLGTEHPNYATDLNNLAGFYSYLGNYAEAIRLDTEAMEIYISVLGNEHLLCAKSLGDLADSYSHLGNYEKAYYYMTQQMEYFHYYILKNLGELSSNYQKSLWTTQFAYAYFNTLPNLVSNYTNKESISELYNNTCLFAKGILLNTGIEMRKLILESRDSSLIHKYNALSTNINVYNKLIEKPIKERYMNTDSLNNVIQMQEMELARESKVYGDYTRNLTITWKEVQRKLKEDDIAIEFLDYPLVGTDSTMYIALTLKKDYDAPHMITLFEGNQLKAISEDVYYTKTDIANLVWKPLKEELSGVKNIYFAPSGELHRIGIEYLPISKTENICDVYTLHRLSSTRQIALIQDETEGKNCVLYGGLDYDEKSNAISTDSISTKESVLRSAFSRANVDSLSLRSSFDYLKGTRIEADMIAEDMKMHDVPYIYYNGIDGTEETFKQLDGRRPKLMHIATHGFFLTEEEAEESKFARPEMELMTDGGQKSGRSVEDKSMTRSGLLFSGCNHAIHHEQIPNGEEDGILTAQEISLLDLRGLDLVVLSACQTGLGDIISGEGVFGLQRGFKKAGAKTILMSLDKVNDDATRILMVEFYRNLMNGKTKYQSLKDAQKHLRQVDNGKYDKPEYWASFIMLDCLN